MPFIISTKDVSLALIDLLQVSFKISSTSKKKKDPFLDSQSGGEKGKWFGPVLMGWKVPWCFVINYTNSGIQKYMWGDHYDEH